MAEPDASDLTDGAAALDIHSGNAAIDDRLNIAQMLSLIDSVLPFEACLYYQVIPLSIESSYLNLGMVNPEDSVAMDYIRRQVSYINYSIISWPISSDWHRQMLSKYLSYAAKTKQRSRQTPPPVVSVVAPAQTIPNEAADRQTFIVDSPDDLRPESERTQAGELPVGTASPGKLASQAPYISSVPPLQIDPIDSYPQRGLADLSQLPPKVLMQTLLNRVMTEGIGRLYFERRESRGRVLWSKDGVVQAALGDLSLELFQSVINEFKRLTHLPLLPTTQTKQVEIERLYRQERVLLRLRLIAGKHGEEATLQVLRGTALKFYQQQQINRLGRDALGIAQSLQKRITEICNRAKQSLSLEANSASTLIALSNLLKDMENQIEQLMQPEEEEGEHKY